MYCNYWSFTENPFQSLVDPKFFFASKEHEEAVSRFMWSLKGQHGIMVLSGEYGCGKTMISQVVIRQLAADKSIQLALIINPRLNVPEFLKLTLYELGGNGASPLKVDALIELKQLLLNNFKAGRGTALVVDDAQAIIDDDVFEEIRLLLSHQQDGKPLIRVILIGQPELKERLSRIKQLEQRVGLWFHLTPFTEEETASYIRHRVKVAGQDKDIFSSAALKSVHGFSGGIPRVINNICNMALMLGWSSQMGELDEQTIGGAVQAIKGVVE